MCAKARRWVLRISHHPLWKNCLDELAGSAMLPLESDFLTFLPPKLQSSMTTLVKIHRKGQMTLPSRLRSAIGLSEGDIVEVTVLRGKIVLTPKALIDRSGFPNADGDYTPQQRRVVDARLAKADEDIRKGRTHGPFATAAETVAHMKEQLKKPAATKKSNPLR